MVFSARTSKVIGAWAIGLGSCALVAAAEPVGYLQSDAPVTVQPHGSTSSVRVAESDYTIFSSDRVTAGESAAVLVLNGGAVIGLEAGSSVRVRGAQGPSPAYSVFLESGTLLYSFPETAGLRMKHGQFTVRPSLSTTRRVDVDQSGADLTGILETLDGGHIRVSVRQGDMDVLVGAGRRHVVTSGQSTGLLSAPVQVAQADLGLQGQRLALIEAPERVISGESFTVRWSGEALSENSYITVAPSGSDPEAFESVASTTQGEAIEFQAPGEPGDYEIRFVDGASGEIAGFAYLQVSGPPVAAPWYTSNAAVTGSIAFLGAAGATALALDDDDEPPQSISP